MILRNYMNPKCQGMSYLKSKPSLLVPPHSKHFIENKLCIKIICNQFITLLVYFKIIHWFSFKSTLHVNVYYIFYQNVFINVYI